MKGRRTPLEFWIVVQPSFINFELIWIPMNILKINGRKSFMESHNSIAWKIAQKVSVESPDDLLGSSKEVRESPSVESPGKLVG
jgi:hypothetical protein